MEDVLILAHTRTHFGGKFSAAINSVKTWICYALEMQIKFKCLQCLAHSPLEGYRMRNLAYQLAGQHQQEPSYQSRGYTLPQVTAQVLGNGNYPCREASVSVEEPTSILYHSSIGIYSRSAKGSSWFQDTLHAGIQVYTRNLYIIHSPPNQI